MKYLDVVDEVNKEVAKLNAIADLIAEQSAEADKTLSSGTAWIIADAAEQIKKLVNDYSG